MKERPIKIKSVEGELPGDRILRAFDVLEGTPIGWIIEKSLTTLRDALGGLRTQSPDEQLDQSVRQTPVDPGSPNSSPYL